MRISGKTSSLRTRPAAAKELKASMYIRVSSEEQIEGYSLDAQERAARAYSEARGWVLGQSYRDEGKSGWTDDITKRPAFSKMLEDAEAGSFDVLIVHKLDRLARNVSVTLEVLNRLEDAGVAFVSISENMDFTTPIGKVVLATLAAFAQYYSENLSAETRKGKLERKRQGLYNGVLPFGAEKGHDGVPRAHARNHAGLALAFAMAAEGCSDREIAKGLNDGGYRTSGNRGANPFTKDTVRAMLQNRFYLGELPLDDGNWMKGRHAPLIDSDLFWRAGAERARNRGRTPQPTTSRRAPWGLSGVGYCVCGAPLAAKGWVRGRQRVECAGRVQGRPCTASSFFAADVEAQMGTILSAIAIPAEQQVALVRQWEQTSAARTSRDDGVAQRKRLETRRERVRELYLSGEIDALRYRSETDSVDAELSTLPLGDLWPDGDAAVRKLAAYVNDVAAAWTDATPEERSRLARALFHSVEVENKRTVACTPRPEVHSLFAAVMGDRRKRRGSRPRARAIHAPSRLGTRPPFPTPPESLRFGTPVRAAISEASTW